MVGKNEPFQDACIPVCTRQKMMEVKIFCVILFFSYSLSAGSLMTSDRTKHPFVAWEHYLQECGAEMPHQCSGSKKALNQSCMFDNDCVAPAVCQKLKCQCMKGFVAYRERCVKAPTLDQQCIDGQCAPPYVCSRRDICECNRTMDRLEQGCDTKCQWDQLLVDGQCLPIVRLGQRCKVSLQCNTAFAYCADDGRCHCVNGTRTVGERCETIPLCPDGTTPLKSQSAATDYYRCHGQTCPTSQLPFVPPRLKLDSCPESYYCIFPSYQDADGFCCREKPYCPMGEPQAGKNCINPRNEAERCPLETHHCYAAPRGTYCCPLPCPSLGLRASVVVDNGQCWERRALRERCNVTAQCPRPAACMNGTCGCPEGFKFQVGPLGEKCQRQCLSGKVLVGSDCLDMVLPGARCTNSAQCTAGTKCVAGICDCPCGTISYNGNCLDVPECPNFGNGIYDPLKTRQGTLVECSPNNFNPNSPPPCPDKSFCHRAMIYSGGICCPLPEPNCQRNRSPPRGRDNEPIICDFSGNSSMTVFCPRGLYCYDYLSVILPQLAQNAGRRGVCCPLDMTNTGGGRYDDYRFQDQSQFQWGQNSVQSSGMCPSGHTAALNTAGQIIRCPYYSYRGQCGSTGSCFLHPTSNARILYNEGICCTWRQF